MKYKSKILGKTVVLEGADYRSMLQRFNPDGKSDRRGTSCSLCERHYQDGDCIGCPFNFLPDAWGCITVLKRITRQNHDGFLILGRSAISWPTKNRKKAIAWLRKIHNRLLKFKAVKE